MNILELIKRRYTIRKYKNESIPDDIVDKIIEAGIWSSSVIGIQPWEFIIMSKGHLTRKISNILKDKSKELESVKKLLNVTANTIANAPRVILVYNQHTFKKIEIKIFEIKKETMTKEYLKIAEQTEIEAISGAIQNMILVAENYGVSSCWNTVPLFCEKEINRIVKKDNALVAILTLGYAAEKTKRSPRRPLSESVQYLMETGNFKKQ